MNNSHPAQFEIQEYVLDKSACGPEIIGHIESCTECLEEVETLRFVISEIKQMPRPAFDFDLTALVIPQLSLPKPRLTADRFVAGFLVIFISCFMAIPVFLFRQYILNMFYGIPPFFIYSIIGSASLIVLIKTLDMYDKYKVQMRLLNIN
jgi:hypothetical protein